MKNFLYLNLCAYFDVLYRIIYKTNDHLGRNIKKRKMRNHYETCDETCSLHFFSLQPQTKKVGEFVTIRS